VFNNAIEVVCNCDFPGRNTVRRFLTVSDLEEMAKQMEKAAVDAATLSEKN